MKKWAPVKIGLSHRYLGICPHDEQNKIRKAKVFSRAREQTQDLLFSFYPVTI
jgi:hypothetical protein